jgi:hypothetical protein
MTRGPFRRLPKSLCDFGDMTSHTLVGGAQTTLTATASARADRRDCPSEAWGPRGKTHTPPPGALDRHAGATGAVTVRPRSGWSPTGTGVGKGLMHLDFLGFAVCCRVCRSFVLWVPPVNSPPHQSVFLFANSHPLVPAVFSTRVWVTLLTRLTADWVLS